MRNLAVIALLLMIGWPLPGQEVITARRKTASGPPPTTVVYANNCAGSNSGAVSGACTWAGGTTPTAGSAVVFVVWTNSSITSITPVTDGGSTYQLANGGAYANASNFKSWVFYTCNFAGTGTDVLFTFVGATTDFYTVGAAATGNTTTGTGCNDGYNHNQSTTASTAPTTSPNTITTTNAHDLMVGFSINACGGTAATAGVDGQGNSYTLRVDQTGVAMVETLAESATAAYIATATIPSCQWNMEAIALK